MLRADEKSHIRDRYSVLGTLTQSCITEGEITAQVMAVNKALLAGCVIFRFGNRVPSGDDVGS